jgi:chemotaxis protein methyltransferase CheR
MSSPAATLSIPNPTSALEAVYRNLFFEGRDRVGQRQRPLPRGPAPARLTDASCTPEVREFYALLFRAAGLNAQHYRGRALARRLPACLRTLQARSPAEASARIAAEPWLARMAVSSVLLGVTEFFRDAPVFRYWEEIVLPSMCTMNPRPRIWSVACSEGQELYSVAMLLAGQRRLERCELLGTDCRADAIERAIHGVFPEDRPVPSHPRWLPSMPGDRRYMSEELRAAIAWKRADVLAGVEPGPWNLILCRNLAIYLEPVAAEHLWSSLADALAPGGHLVVGKADYPSRHLPLRRVASGTYVRIS